MVVDKSVLQKVVRYLKQLGLDDEQAEMYLYLLEHDAQTVLALSRGLKSGRTKLYPLLNDLAAKQLVAIHERHYGTTYEAQKPEVLDFLVAESERKAENLRKNLPAISHALKSLQASSPSNSRVIEYQGVDGLKQMNWNLNKANKEYRVFELAGLDKHLGNHFANKMRQIVAEKQLRTYDLTNNPNRAAEPGVVSPLSEARYIDPTVFKIEFETYIYNNCVALLNYDREDIFGVEIYNDKLAAQQMQIFDLLWSLSRPLK